MYSREPGIDETRPQGPVVNFNVLRADGPFAGKWVWVNSNFGAFCQGMLSTLTFCQLMGFPIITPSHDRIHPK